MNDTKDPGIEVAAAVETKLEQTAESVIPSRKGPNLFEQFVIQGIKMRRLQKAHKQRGGQSRLFDKKVAEEKFDKLLNALLEEASKPKDDAEHSNKS